MQRVEGGEWWGKCRHALARLDRSPCASSLVGQGWERGQPRAPGRRAKEPPPAGGGPHETLFLGAFWVRQHPFTWDAGPLKRVQVQRRPRLWRQQDGRSQFRRVEKGVRQQQPPRTLPTLTPRDPSFHRCRLFSLHAAPGRGCRDPCGCPWRQDVTGQHPPHPPHPSATTSPSSSSPAFLMFHQLPAHL